MPKRPVTAGVSDDLTPIPADQLHMAQSIPDRPHMPAAAIEFLEARLREVNCFLEYGAGGSTRLAASVGVPRIVSVETDREFAKAVTESVTQIHSESSLHMIWVDLGPTKEWGMPATYNAYRDWPTYALRPWDFLRRHKLSPELILIDGRFRVASLFASLLEASPGTTILFDDYLLRPNSYGYVGKILTPTQTIGNAAVFTVPDTIPVREVARSLARYSTRSI